MRRRVRGFAPCFAANRTAIALTRRSLLWGLLLLLVCGLPRCAQAFPTEPVAGRSITAWTPGGFQPMPAAAVSGQVLVKLRQGTTLADFEAALDRQGGRVLSAIPSLQVYVVSLPEGIPVSAGVNNWSQEGCVELAEPDYVGYFLRTPNDPEYSRQYQWPRVNAPAAWDITTGSSSVVVAVVDTGVDLVHPDLEGKTWINTDEIPNNGTDDDNNGFIDDANGWDFGNNDNDPNPNPSAGANPVMAHGTHCAGLVGAQTNNGVGVAGHDWSCRIMAVKCAEEDTGDTNESILLNGFMYAVNNGAHVISCSFALPYSDLWTDAVAQANARGIVVCVAAGNDYSEITSDPQTWYSPLCNDGPFIGDNFVLGVAATDRNDRKADFSNYDGSGRSFVDVCAPGENILSTLLYRPAVAGFDQPYGEMSGTSMSAPIVAGLAALVKATSPGASAGAVIRQIKISCDNIDAQNPRYAGKLGSGRINSGVAVTDAPPLAPRSVSAFDTPGDEGGSITVTWSKSQDDGRGYNDVTGYEVQRATSKDGPFVTVSPRLAKGTTLFLDTSVAANTSYWYKVLVYDARNVTESKVAGPAMGRDDLAPPQVDTLTATDTQADEGGSITLNWSGYAPPSDFAEYRVYRAEAAFSSIKATGVTITQIATITNPGQQAYVDPTTQDGTSYYYAVTAVDDTQDAVSPRGNENPNVKAAGPVVSSPNFSFTYPPGLSIIAIGADTQEKDLGKLFGLPSGSTVDFAWFDPVTNQYRRYSQTPGDPSLRQALGKGFWLSTADAILLSVAGQPAPAGDVSVAVMPGWNMIGNPYTTDMDITGATMTVGGETLSLGEAARRGWCRDYMWAYDAFLRSYRLVSPTIGFADKLVRRGRGVFFKSLVSGTITLPRPPGAAVPKTQPNHGTGGGTTQQVRPVLPPTIPIDWKLALTAHSNAGADLDNFVGVSPQAAALNGLISPPAEGVDLFFEGPGGVRSAAAFATPDTRQMSYTVKVWSAAAGPVTLRWPDLSAVPHDLRPYLVDTASGKRVYLRTSTQYTYEAAPNAIRQFRLELKPSDGNALVVRSLAARPARPGAQVICTLSRDATMTVEVLNLAGRVVRRLATAEPVTGGETITLAWDGRSTSGARVPDGRYLVRLTAEAEDGQLVSAAVGVVIGH